jgi:hypothetical protein
MFLTVRAEAGLDRGVCGGRAVNPYNVLALLFPLSALFPGIYTLYIEYIFS